MISSVSFQNHKPRFRSNALVAAFLAFLSVILIISCDSGRVYENYSEFPDRTWKTPEKVRFEFAIPDTTLTYSLYYDIRNTIDYPFARIFVMYQLVDSSNNELTAKLLNNDLFDQKTGRPFGDSGLGDIYDHRFTLVDHYRFNRPGTYAVTLSQFMRQDTLKGILAVGVRVEKNLP